MELSQEQEMSAAIQDLQTEVREIKATLDIAINYMQVVAVKLGLREKVKKLDAELEAIRSRTNLPPPSSG